MSLPVVVFPDVELLLVDYLRDTLPDYGEVDTVVRTRKPNEMPDTPVIQVRRVGGIRQTVVSDFPRVDLLVWADTDKHAQDLTQLARALLLALPGTPGLGAVVYRCDEFLGPTRYADPDSDQPRWLATIEVATRGTTVDPTGS